MSTYEYMCTHVYIYTTWTHESCHMSESYIHIYTYVRICTYTYRFTYENIHTYVYYI